MLLITLYLLVPLLHASSATLAACLLASATVSLGSCGHYDLFPSELSDDQTAVHFIMTEKGASTYIGNSLGFVTNQMKGALAFDYKIPIGGLGTVTVSEANINDLKVKSYTIPLVEGAEYQTMEAKNIFVDVQVKVVINLALSTMTAVIGLSISDMSAYGIGEVSISDTCKYHIKVDMKDMKVDIPDVSLRVVETDSPLLKSLIPSFKDKVVGMLKGENGEKTFKQMFRLLDDSLDSAVEILPWDYSKYKGSIKTGTDIRRTGFTWGRKMVVLKAGGHTYSYEDPDKKVIFYEGERETGTMPTQLNDKDWQFVVDISAFKSNIDVNHRYAKIYDTNFIGRNLKSAFLKSGEKKNLNVTVVNNRSPKVVKIGGAGLRYRFDVNLTVSSTKSEEDPNVDKELGTIQLVFDALATVNIVDYMSAIALNSSIIYPDFQRITSIDGKVVDDKTGQFHDGDMGWLQDIGRALEIDYFGVLLPISKRTGIGWENLNFADMKTVQVVYFPETFVLVSGDFFRLPTQ